MRAAFLALLLGSAAVAAPPPKPPVLFGEPLSPRNASYRIRVRLDETKHALAGEETIVWTNPTRDAVPDLVLHLYLNAFANDGTVFMKESGGRHRMARFDEKSYGYSEVKELALVRDGVAVPLRPEYPAPDRTILRAALPSPVPAGGTIELRVRFEAQLPAVFARTGFAESFHLGGQWFPKIAVYRDGRGWSAHPMHLTTEFFADFGTYDVDLDVPSAYVVGATGTIWDERESAPGRKTVRCRAEDVHDFAWVASPRILERTARWRHVSIRALMQPETLGSAPRYLEAARRTLEFLDAKLGPYPYSTLTIVDPPPDAPGAAGMEYPTFVTAGAVPLAPSWVRLAELVVVHEVAHQYWYGMSANDEFEEPWLDEGLATYHETRVMGAWFGEDRAYLDGPLGLRISAVGLQRASFLSEAETAPVTILPWEYPGFGAYGAITYAKPALALYTLESLHGRDAVDRAMKLLFERARFRHPTTADAIEAIREAIGDDAAALFRRLLDRKETVNFDVSSVRNHRADRPEGWDLSGKGPVPYPEPKDDDSGAPGRYETRVVVTRHGALELPVSILVRFEDGTSRTESWDGKGSERELRFEGSKVVVVEVDPDSRVVLETRRLDNGWREEGDPRSARSLTSRFLWFVQGLFSALLAPV